MKPLNEFETLEDARAYSVIEPRLISASVFSALLADAKIANLLISLDDDSATIFKMRIASDGDFSFIQGDLIGDKNLAYVDWLISQYPERNPPLGGLKDAVIAYCNPTVFPYANKSEVEWNRAKGIHTENLVSGWINGSSKIIITLNQDLPEQCSATTWDRDEGYSDENLGRSVIVHKAGQYKIKTRGIIADGSVYVRIPFAGVDFSVRVE